MAWNQWLTREHSPGEINNGPRLVEPGESLPTRVLVERMMNAGVMNSVYKALTRMYEFPVGQEVPDVFIGPRGRYNSDIVDIFNLKRWLAAKIKGQQEEAAQAIKDAEKAKEEASAASQAGSGVEGDTVPSGNDAGGTQ